ncbi:MAG: hypothetical protein ACJAXX_001430 [Roseivirga sp.]
MLEIAVKDSQFNSGCDVLKSSSNGSLNQVVLSMKEDNFSLELAGIQTVLLMLKETSGDLKVELML